MLVTDPAAQNLLFAAGTALGLYGLTRGLKTGSSSDVGGIQIKRSENPVSYWISIAINGAIGFGCLSMLIYRLLF